MSSEEGSNTRPSRPVTKSVSVDRSDFKKDMMESEPSFIPATAPSWVLAFMAVMAVIAGATNTLVQKFMNMQVGAPCEGCEERYFEAPNFFVFLMWCGEFVCMFIWLGDTWYSKRHNRVPPTDMVTNPLSFKKPHCPFYFWLLPCLFDYVASTCINYANLWGEASTVQLLRNFNVLITAGISTLYLQVALRRRHWIGILIVSLGLVLTGMYSLLHPEDDNNESRPVVGVVLALVGTSINGFQVIFQESLFRKYYASPFEGIGWMGVFGIVISVGVLILGETLGWEDVSGNFYMIRNNWILLLGVFIYTFNVVLLNAGALSVSKLGSGVLWQVVKASRSVIVWCVELILVWTTFMWLSFWGMFFVTLGSLYYNAILWPSKWTPKFWAWNRKPVMCSCGCINLRDPDVPRADPDKIAGSDNTAHPETEGVGDLPSRKADSEAVESV